VLVPKGITCKLYPNNIQQTKIDIQMALSRFAYNKLLEKRIDYYRSTGEFLDYRAYHLKDEYQFLNQLGKASFDGVERRLNHAYKMFFKGLCGFPKFKSRKRDKATCIMYNYYSQKRLKSGLLGIRSYKIELKNNHIKLPIIGWIGCRGSTNISGANINFITIEHTKSNDYVIHINYDNEIVLKPTINNSDTSVIGLDMSLKYGYVGNKAGFYKPKYNLPDFKVILNKISDNQRSLSRKKKNSSNYMKCLVKLNKSYEHLRSIKNNWLHKNARHLVDNFNYIIVEDLSIKKMMSKNTKYKLGKSFSNVSWYKFTNQLTYKLEDRHGMIIKVNPKNTSKTCNRCGYINDNLKLSDTWYKCPKCGYIENRDINASKNIYDLGMIILQTELNIYGVA